MDERPGADRVYELQTKLLNETVDACERLLARADAAAASTLESAQEQAMRRADELSRGLTHSPGGPRDHGDDDRGAVAGALARTSGVHASIDEVQAALERELQLATAARERAELEAAQIIALARQPTGGSVTLADPAFAQIVAMQEEMLAELEAEVEDRLRDTGREVARRLDQADRLAAERLREAEGAAAALLDEARREAKQIRQGFRPGPLPSAVVQASIVAAAAERGSAAISASSEADDSARARPTEPESEAPPRDADDADDAATARLLDADIEMPGVLLPPSNGDTPGAGPRPTTC